MKKTVDMLSGSITKGLLAMSIPIVIMNVMQNLFNVIDMTVLGRFADDTAVGAVGACGMLISLCNSLLIGVAAGANVMIARHIGAGNKERAERAIGTAMAFAILGGLVLLVIGVSCAEIFLKWTNCPEKILPQAVLYFRIYFIGSPVLMFYTFGASVLRAMGDTKRPMYFAILGGIVKVILNIACITLLNTTVEGVAVATIASNIIAGGLSMQTILKTKEKVDFTLKKIKISMTELKSALYIGIPTGLQTSMYSLANVIIATAVNSFGADATTGISIANQFDGILYQVIHSPSLAIMPYVSQNLGAKQMKRVKQTFLRGALITTAMGATLGAMSAIFSGRLSSIMSSTPAVIAYSQQKMVIISSTYFICGINEVLGGVLKGMGKPMLPTVATFVYMCVLRFIWVYGIFPLCPNLTFLYLVWPIGWILSIVTLIIPYLHMIKKMEKERL